MIENQRLISSQRLIELFGTESERWKKRKEMEAKGIAHRTHIVLDPQTGKATEVIELTTTDYLSYQMSVKTAVI